MDLLRDSNERMHDASVAEDEMNHLFATDPTKRKPRKWYRRLGQSAWERRFLILFLALGATLISLSVVWLTIKLDSSSAEPVFVSHPKDEATSEPDHALPLVIISLDGFRYEYLERGLSPALNQLATEGVRASRMEACFPTLTFPNHYSIATGVYPAVHGIVSNKFYDPDLKRMFAYQNSDVYDPKWWLYEPIWITLKRFAKKSAVIHWPGSAVPFGRNQLPNYLVPFSKKLTLAANMYQIFEWLGLPPDQRPSFIASYVSTVDQAGHDFGPDGQQMNSAILEVDAMIHHFVQGLKNRNLYDKVNLLIVSDHGMQSVDLENGTIYLDQIISIDLLEYVEVGSVVQIFPRFASDVSSLYAALEAAAASTLKFSVYLKETLPREYHYGNSPRVAPMILIAKPRHFITLSAYTWRPGGLHGYPYPNPDMNCIFVGRGPNIVSYGGQRSAESGETSKAFDTRFSNLDLYPFMAKLMNIRGLEGNGTGILIDHFYKK